MQRKAKIPMREKLQQLKKNRESLCQAGGAEKIKKQHDSGKLTARERINLLFDHDTFVEIGAFVSHRCESFGMEEKHLAGDGVITGYGKIDGRTVFAYAQDFTVFGGSVGEAHGQKISHIIDMAMKTGAPVVGLNDSGGARIQEGVEALGSCGKIFFSNARASGVVPQINAIMGPCAGGAVYSPALSDFIFMVEGTGRMFVTGNEVVKTISGEKVTDESLGGAVVHSRLSGVASFTDPDDVSCIFRIRKLLSYLPSNSQEKPPEQKFNGGVDKTSKKIQSILPKRDSRSYNMYEIIEEITDEGSVLTVAENYAKNIITCFARLDGKTVAIVANQPKVMAGCLDCNASDKAARFIRFCDCFGIPLLTIVDVPGFLPGVNQEHAGIIRHGAKVLYAYSEATVPKITLILRKAYGGAYTAMCSKDLGADMVFAWPTAEIAAMGPEEAVGIIFKNEDDETKELKREEYKAKFETPYIAAARGLVDSVIEPCETRETIINALEMLRGKQREFFQKRHGNMPV